MKKISIITVVSLLSFSMWSCDVEPIPPIKTPTPSTSSISTKNINKAGTLTVSVVDGLSKQAVNSANVKVIYNNSNRQFNQKTDENGKALFDSLDEGSNYTIEASASDYQSTTLNSQTSKIGIKQNTNFDLTINLFKVSGNLLGRIISDSGIPLSGAAVKLNSKTVFTDGNGNFKLKIDQSTNNVSITVSKIGFTTKVFSNFDFSKQFEINTGDLKLEKKTSTVFFIDTSKNPFGGIEGESIALFSQLNNIAKENGFTTQSDNFFNSNINTDDIDVLYIASPSIAYSDSEVTKIVDFVKSGKKLIISGEWGGYAGFSVESANKILKYANLKINTDIVKEKNIVNIIGNNNEQITQSTLNEHFITKGISKISFYSSASIDIISGGVTPLDPSTTKYLALSSSNSFKIQSFYKGPVGLIAVSAIDSGKVIALGDTSIFTDSFSDGLTSNILAFDNKQLVNNIFNW